MPEPLTRSMHALLSCAIAVAAICVYPIMSIMRRRYTQSSPNNDTLYNSPSVLLIAVTGCLLDAHDTIAAFSSTAHPTTL